MIRIDPLVRALVLTGLLSLSACSGEAHGSGAASTGGENATGGVTGGATSGATGGSTAGGGAMGGVSGVPECGETPLKQVIAFRLEAPPGAAVPSDTITTPQVVELSGLLTDVADATEPCTSCSSGTTPALRLAVTSEEGPIWTLVVLTGELSERFRSEANKTVGVPVFLRVRYARRFQYPRSSSFLLSDAAGPLFASEAGPFVETLQAGDLPSLEVTRGVDLCRSPSGCGRVMLSELVFHADTSVSVSRYADGAIKLDGLGYGARNSGGGYLIPDGCSDGEHASTWSIWRESAP